MTVLTCSQRLLGFLVSNRISVYRNPNRWSMEAGWRARRVTRRDLHVGKKGDKKAEKMEGEEEEAQ